MAQYFDDFTAATVGSPPPGWTTQTGTLALEVVEDAAASGGVALKIGPGSALVRNSFVSFDAVTADANRADFEVLVRSRAYSNNATGQNLCGAAGRVFTTSTESSGFNGYTAGRRAAGWRDRGVSTVSSGTVTILGTTADPTTNSDTYCFGRFLVSGTDLKYRSWEGALEDEPTAWDVETTNSTHGSAGFIGVWRNLLTNDVHVDFFGVGTGGDAAPSGPVGGANTQVATSPGTLGLSGPAPSSAFSGAITSAPGVGTLTITPQAAEILFSGAITSAPEPGLLDLAGHPSQSAFSGAVTSATLPGSLAFSGLAGQIIVSGAATVTVLTAAGALGLTGAAPSSAYSGTVSAQTLPGLLALAGVAPGLMHSGAVTVELLAGELSIDGQAVETTIGGGIRVETAAGLLSLLGDAPSVVISGGVRVETQPGSLALAGATPVMIHAGLIEIVTAAGGLSIAGLPVTVSAGERLGPIFAPGLHSITVQRAVLSVTPVRGLRRFDVH